MAAGATYEPIATTTLSSAASSITFSSISSAYTDLILVVAGVTSAGGGGNVALQLNGDTGTNYSYTRISGNGTTAASGRGTSQAYIPNIAQMVGLSSTIPAMGFFHIFSYAGSTYKTVLCEDSSDFNGSGAISRTVGLWRNTAAVTSVTAFNNSAINFNSGTTATLYGIKAA